MKKTVFLFFAVLAAFAAIAQMEDGGKDGGVEARGESRQRAFLEKTGGFIVKPGSRLGEIVYVNCQGDAPIAWIEEVAAYFARVTRFNVSVRKGEFRFANPEIAGNATLFVVSDAGMPALLVAPESRWALVNVAAVAGEKKGAFFRARVQKELSRGFAFLCGATDSRYPRSLTRGIAGHSDLDRNPDFELPADVVMRFTSYMAAFGVTPAVRSTYRNACREGWAPAPTNEVQRAIWNKIHAVPDKPITIEFDPKKDR